MTNIRKNTKPINIGNVQVGGNSPISVQSMTKTPTTDVEKTLTQIFNLHEFGCDIVRCAVPDMESAIALKEIVKNSPIPIIADIHFHYELAIESINSGVKGLRLNPGNIRDSSKISDIVKNAKLKNIPIRIGVNFGSLPPVGSIGKTKGISRHKMGVEELPKNSNGSVTNYSQVEHMIRTALWEIDILESLQFYDIKISMKAFDIETTVEAYKGISNLVPYPLHLGVTESGTKDSGSIRSAIGIGMLLYEGIGDTIRVSLSDDPIEEVKAGNNILKALNLKQSGITLVSCPGCARADVDIIKLANDVDKIIQKSKSKLKIAVMGCEVNGPGEAKDADLGIAAGVGKAVIFKKGKKEKIVSSENMLKEFENEIRKMENTSK
jgi:(E)-4-hydroxy-3-methylbut-2-enyl-diphosphate synthase